jgi:hypothetical protein
MPSPTEVSNRLVGAGRSLGRRRLRLLSEDRPQPFRPPRSRQARLEALIHSECGLSALGHVIATINIDDRAVDP